MPGKTKIEWATDTWNPVTGCDRVSPGCDHCYALDMAGRLKLMGSKGYQNDGDPRTSGPGFALTLQPDRLDQPLRWTKPRKIFVNSMSDLFHEEVPDDFIRQVFDVMGKAEQHTFQVLTKRPRRLPRLFRDLDGRTTPIPVHPNVWMGTSIENDKYTFRARHLRETPAAVRFLSCEPLLGPLPTLNLDGIDWVIVGGESGPKARPMHPDWARDIRDRCVEADVPFLFKQWGEWRPFQEDDDPTKGQLFNGDGTDSLASIIRVGKHHAGRELDGRTWDEYPA